MKTKLLKKIRKRFSIAHYPNGIKVDNTVVHSKFGFLMLWDLKGGFYDSVQKEYSLQDLSLEEALDLAKERILKYCRDNYTSKAKRKTKIDLYKGIKLWHNG